MGKSLVSCFFETRCMFCVRHSVVHAPFFVKSVHEIVADKLTGIARSKSLTVKFNMDCGTRNPLDRSIFD